MCSYAIRCSAFSIMSCTPGCGLSLHVPAHPIFRPLSEQASSSSYFVALRSSAMPRFACATAFHAWRSIVMTGLMHESDCARCRARAEAALRRSSMSRAATERHPTSSWTQPNESSNFCWRTAWVSRVHVLTYIRLTIWTVEFSFELYFWQLGI